MFEKQPWHDNKSPNPFRWEPVLFFAGWLILMLILFWFLGPNL